MHYLWAIVHDCTSMNYFPGNDQKNSLNGSSSMFSKCKYVWWCERLLLLPWRNLPSPPQGRNRETTEEGREGEKTVYSGSQFAYQGHDLFSVAGISLRAARERKPDVCLVCEWLMLISPCRDGLTEHMACAWCVWSIYWLKCVMYRLKDAHACQSM